MQVLTNRNTIKELMERHGFNFSKSLGQNFIINPAICPKMAELSGANQTTGVIEIGAGIGVLTAELAQLAKKVVCIEIDNSLLPILDETLSDYDNIKIINQDVLKTDLKQIINDEFAGLDVIVCANLPYYITSPIIMSILEQKLPINSITVMVQKEAAQRICAPLGTRGCGAITASVNYYSTPQILFPVSSGSFMPAPDVDSAVMKLVIHKTSPVTISDEKMLFKVIKYAFSQRRKTILNSLSSGFSIPKDKLNELLESINIKPTSRAENLTLTDFAAIANVVTTTI